jgi:hypothetical protein
MTSRRAFLRGLAASAALSAYPAAARRLAQPSGDPWRALPAILARITPPSFAPRDFDVTTFGARGDNEKDNTASSRAARSS